MKHIAPVSQGMLSKTLSFSLTFIIILTTVIGACAYFLSTEVIKQDTRNTLAAIAIVKEDNLNRWVDEQRRNIVLIAALPEIRAQAGILSLSDNHAQERASAAKKLEDYFRTIISTTSSTQEILLLDTQGNIIVSSISAHVGANQKDETYFTEGFSWTSVTTFYKAPLLETPTITISTPLYNDSGKQVGVLAAHLNLNEVDRIIRERSGLGETGEVYLVNKERQIISIDPLAAQNGIKLQSTGIDEALKGGQNTAIYENYRGERVTGAYRWIEERDVALIVEVSLRESLSATRTLSLWIALIGGIIVLFSILIIVIYTRRMVKPIETLTHTAINIAGGDLNLRAPVTSKDEVGRLAEAFNVMTNELQMTLHGLEELNDQLENRVEERTAELKHSNQELEAFSYSISHDLRAPLRAITGYSQMLRDQLGNSLGVDECRKLEHIHESSVFMGQMVDGLLSFSRLGRQSMRPQMLSETVIGGMLNNIIDDLKQDPLSKNVSVTIGAIKGCYADHLLLNQVFANLISNAFKFSRQQSNPTVEIGCIETAKGCTFYVRDNGVGFDMQFSNKLFGVFQRLHKQEEFEGTGVGLAIVQRIIHRHKGEVWANSERGKGTTFYFTVGLKENDASIERATGEPKYIQPQGFAPRGFLITKTAIW